MQAVIAIPNRQTLQSLGGVREALLREVAGVSLLIRTIATAIRAGVDSVVIIWPDDVDSAIWEGCAESSPLQGLKVAMLVQRHSFDPRSTTRWAFVGECLASNFLWLPWNWATHQGAIAALAPMPVPPLRWDFPALIERHAVLYGTRVRVFPSREENGLAVNSRTDVARAERLLVAQSSKRLDGIYSEFNRLLCRPVVRLLTHTRTTPSWVTVGGLGVAVLAAFMLARGSYANSVGGALLFWLSRLFGEMDGMIARLKFMESAVATWFEGLADNATCLLVFSGLTVGLYRQRGEHELLYAVALIVGCALSVVVVAIWRKIPASPDRPHEYTRRLAA